MHVLGAARRSDLPEKLGNERADDEAALGTGSGSDTSSRPSKRFAVTTGDAAGATVSIQKPGAVGDFPVGTGAA